MADRIESEHTHTEPVLPLSVIEKVRDITNLVTPLQQDCGVLCQKLCCSQWDQKVGMYLLPGEQQLYGQKDKDWILLERHSVTTYDICPSLGNFQWFAECKGSCRRDRRPFECRVFPLSPSLGDDGTIEMVLNVEAALICPLVQADDLELLDSGFISACREAWSTLSQYPFMKEYLIWLTRRHREERAGPLQKLLQW